MYARKPEPAHTCACASALTPPALQSPALPGCLLPAPLAARSPCQSPRWKELSQGPVLLCRPRCGSAQGSCRDLQHARLCPTPACPRRVHTGVRTTAPLPSTAPASVPFVSWSLRLCSRPLHWAEGCDLAKTCVLYGSPHRQSGVPSGLPRHPQRSVASLPATKEPLHICSSCARAPM